MEPLLEAYPSLYIMTQALFELSLYHILSAVAQILFAISAIPYYLEYRKSKFKTWTLFEWTWYIAEILMICGSVGLGRYDLLPGLLINFIFLSLCFKMHLQNRSRRKQMEEHLRSFLQKVQDAGHVPRKEGPDLDGKIVLPEHDTHQ